MKRTVAVIQDDIDNGVREMSTECPVARAVARDLADLVEGSPVEVAVTRLYVFALDEQHIVRHAWLLPHEVSRFVQRFDRGSPVQPFKFELELG